MAGIAKDIMILMPGFLQTCIPSDITPDEKKNYDQKKKKKMKEKFGVILPSSPRFKTKRKKKKKRRRKNMFWKESVCWKL